MPTPNLDDRNTELTLTAAAEVCGCSTKTLTRDRNEGHLTMRSDDGKLVVTVGALIDAGRYNPVIGETVAERLQRGKREQRVVDLERRVMELTAECERLRLQVAHGRDVIARADSELNVLRPLVLNMAVA